jgi:ribosomal protein S18 acetylase RimI-like enzyme
MFATPELASRIDRAEGRLCAGIAREAGAADDSSFVVEVGGGVAVFAGPGSPVNKMIGMGFDGMPDEDDLARVERLFADRQAPLQAEVATLADPALHAALVRRGYEPAGFENVLGGALPDIEPSLPEGIVLAAVDPDACDEWVDVVVRAFASPDTGGVGGDTIPPSDELRRWMTLTMRVDGFRCIAARIGGALAGGGALRIDRGIAQLCGAATLPEFRRRGIQTALLRWRLAHARSLGCDVAVVTTQPGSKSQQNVQRSGLQLLYARQLLVKKPAPAVVTSS